MSSSYDTLSMMRHTLSDKLNSRISPSHLCRERVLSHEACHVPVPCFYCSPEQTNQTLALEMAFCVFKSPDCRHRYSYMLGKGGVRVGVFI